MDSSVEKITSRSNKICIHMKKLGKSKSYRDEHRQFICDGLKLLDEAVSSGIDIDVVISSKTIDFQLPVSTRIYHADEDLIDSISPLQNSQGLLFVCNYPQDSNCDFNIGTHILLDDIQDPGNVGTIIRSAYAFGICSVILTDGCADICNLKTIRASMGAVFRQRIYRLDFDGIMVLKKEGMKFIGAENDDSSIDITKIKLSNVVVIIGNEGQGISKELLTLCDEMVKIPVAEGCESLNAAVAASIIIWEAWSSASTSV